MKLVNGRGQLGEALKKLSIPGEVTIYHTWNFLDKSEEAQVRCYEQFLEYRKTHPEERIVFISTHSEKTNPYVSYKRISEQIADGVVRLPILIGKGICQKFRDEDVEAWGEMDIIEIEEAADLIAEYANSMRCDVMTVKGTTVPARIVKRLIQFGKNAV